MWMERWEDSPLSRAFANPAMPSSPFRVGGLGFRAKPHLYVWVGVGQSKLILWEPRYFANFFLRPI